MRITVLKYYSVGTYHNMEFAGKRLAEVEERYPDRQYAIMTNMRSGATKFVVSQVAMINVDFSTEDELGLPPLPQRPPWNDDQATADYMHELRQREALVTRAQLPAVAAIKKKLNSP